MVSWRIRSKGWLIAAGLVLVSHECRALDFAAGSLAIRGCHRGAAQLRISAAAYLEPAPVLYATRYGGRYYEPADGNNIGFATAFAELSARIGEFCLGLVAREEWVGHASRDLLDAVVANHEGKPFETGREYRLAYQLQMLQADGLRLHRTFTVFQSADMSLRLGVGLSLLKATQGRQEWGYGAATASGADFAIGTATWTRIDDPYSKSSFNSFVGVPHPAGWGYATDLEFQADFRSGTAAALVIMDPESRIYWHDIADSARYFNDATVSYNADLNRNALETGMDRRIDDVQRLPVEYRASLDQRIGHDWHARISDSVVEGYHFPSLGVRYGSADRFAGPTFDIRSRALGIAARWRWVEVSAASNRLPLSEATALAVSIQFSRLW